MSGTERPIRAFARRLGLTAGAIALVVAGAYVYIRFWRGNFHEVVPGKVYRSAQPSAPRLRRWIDQHNIRTIINLRGESSKAFLDAERRIARQKGVELINIRFSAVNLPPKPWLSRLIKALETAETPILLHCRDGADRSGVASVLAAMALGGERIDQASSELSWYYLHFDETPDHIAGLVRQFERWCRQDPSRRGTWEEFKHWAAEVYRVRYYYVDIRAPEALTLAPGEKRTVTLTIANESNETLPLGDTGREFAVVAFLGTSIEDRPGRRMGPWRILKGDGDLPPGESVTLDYLLNAPCEPGVYDVRLDMVEQHETWFARQGSPMGHIRLTVASPGEKSPDADPPREQPQGDPAP